MTEVSPISGTTIQATTRLTTIDGTAYIAPNSGALSVGTPFDGSIPNETVKATPMVYGTTYYPPMSGWDYPTYERTSYKEKAQILRKDRKALIRLEDDGEGKHFHYDNFTESGFRFKLFKPPISFTEFPKKSLEVKKEVNGLVKSIKKKSKDTDK